MQSLRRKNTLGNDGQPKTKRSGPPKAPKPSSGSKPSADARKSRVGDKIKKRMSMRYADISEPIGIPAVPSLPRNMNLRPILRGGDEEEEIMLGYDASGARNGMRREVRGQPLSIVINTEELQQPDFNPEEYLKMKATTTSESELKMLQSSLQTAKEEASANLQRSIFQNYEEFVLISKEISTLENDMIELKEGLAEWKNMPALLNIDDASSTTADRRRQNRSSVADLTKLYATQIATLHSTVEGSAKFVPTIPGRHVISEYDSLWCLNAATYKVEYAVHFVLLDDALLIAKRRKRRAGEGGKLVAEKCWPLNEITMIDVKDSVEVSRAFRIKRGRENYAYRCDKNADKKSLLTAFKLASEEYAARRRKEREGEHERRRSLWSAGERTSIMVAGDLPPVPTLPGTVGISAGGRSLAKVEQETSWTSEFMDELSIAIALRRWPEAVKLVEQGKQRLSTMQALTSKLTPLVASLTAALVNALGSDSTLRKPGVVALISHLLALGEGPAARDAFLGARSNLIRKRTRMIALEGEISLYVSELAIVIFTSIKHTAEWYLASFKENDMASGLVQWVTVQLELFATLFKRQLDSSQVDPEDVQQSMQVMRAQSKRLLRDNNLDFTYLLENLLSDTTTPAPAPISSSTSMFTPASRPPRTVPALSIPSAPPSPSRSAARPRVPRSPGVPPPRSRDRPPSAVD